MSAFERSNMVNTTQARLNADVDRAVMRGVGRAGNDAVGPDAHRKQGLDDAQRREMIQAFIEGGVQARPEKIPGAFYLEVHTDDPETAWGQIADTAVNVSLTDTTIMDDENYVSYSLKYFQNTFSLARSMLCCVEGEDTLLLLEINRMEGDGFGFADLFVKEFSEALGDLCSKPVFVEDPELEQARQENQDEEFLDLSADVGKEMIEHWLSALRPAGGVKYNAERIYDALSSLGWNCQDPENFDHLREYTEDIVEPIFSIFLRQYDKTAVGVDHIPSVFYACKILNQFANAEEMEKTNLTVANLCAMGLRYCDPNAQQDSEHKIKTSKQALILIFETLEQIAPQVNDDTERDEDIMDAINSFCQSCSSMFGDDSMDDRIASLSQVLGVALEEDLNGN